VTSEIVEITCAPVALEVENPCPVEESKPLMATFRPSGTDPPLRAIRLIEGKLVFKVPVRRGRWRGRGVSGGGGVAAGVGGAGAEADAEVRADSVG
jgi:hypothetical protein